MFFRRRLVNDAHARWIAESFAWIARTLGPVHFFEEAPLVLPTRDFIDAPPETSHRTAGIVFGQVKELMGVGDWPCQLEEAPLHHGATPVSDRLMLQPAEDYSALAMFEIDESGVTIRYDPAMLDHPRLLIATFAHELSHYILAPHYEDSPYDMGLFEQLTDLMAIAAGFGVFVLETCFVSRSGVGGWSVERNGYLRPEDATFALALFIRATGESEEDALVHLSGPKADRLRDGLRQLDREPEWLEIVMEAA